MAEIKAKLLYGNDGMKILRIEFPAKIEPDVILKVEQALGIKVRRPHINL